MAAQKLHNRGSQEYAEVPSSLSLAEDCSESAMEFGIWSTSMNEDGYSGLALSSPSISTSEMSVQEAEEFGNQHKSESLDAGADVNGMMSSCPQDRLMCCGRWWFLPLVKVARLY